MFYVLVYILEDSYTVKSCCFLFYGKGHIVHVKIIGFRIKCLDDKKLQLFVNYSENNESNTRIFGNKVFL